MGKFDDLKQEALELQEQLLAINDIIGGAAASIREEFVAAIKAGVPDAAQYAKDFSTATTRLQALAREQVKLIEKSKEGQNVSKELAKNQTEINAAKIIQEKVLEKIQESQILSNDKLLNQIRAEVLELDLATEAAKKKNIELQRAIPIEKRLGDMFKGQLDQIDKTGTLKSLLFAGAASFLDVIKGLFVLIVKGAADASKTAASFRKELGISSEASYELRSNMAATSMATENSFINVQRLAKGFVDLSRQTGLVADFGGRTLETFTVLSDQMGLGAENASKLALYARLQSRDTEAVLDDTVGYVGTLIQAKGISFDTREIMKDIASASAATAVSLGKNPKLLAEAAIEARALGTNLNEVEQIAGKLLDFEQSISAELEAELLSGRQINLEKARLAALNNDLATVSEELMNNEAAIEAFASGNRIQQEAIASALGVSREQLAQMTLQQEYNRLSAEQFKDVYGEVTYEQLKSRDVQERLADTMAKIVEIAANLGSFIAPVLDVILAITSNGPAVVGIFTALAARAMLMGLGTLTAATALTGGLIAGVIAASIAAFLRTGQQATQVVQDGIAESNRGPFTITDSYGAKAVTTKGDNLALVATPNLKPESQSVDMSETNRLLAGLLNKNTNFSIGPQHLGTGMNLYTYVV